MRYVMLIISVFAAFLLQNLAGMLLSPFGVPAPFLLAVFLFWVWFLRTYEIIWLAGLVGILLEFLSPYSYGINLAVIVLFGFLYHFLRTNFFKADSLFTHFIGTWVAIVIFTSVTGVLNPAVNYFFGGAPFFYGQIGRVFLSAVLWAFVFSAASLAVFAVAKPKKINSI